MKRISRRSFLKAGSLAGLAAAIGFPTIIPSRAFGANDKIVMAAIGVGGQGTGNLRAFLAPDDVQVVAFCDVDKNHRQNAANIVNERLWISRLYRCCNNKKHTKSCFFL